MRHSGPRRTIAIGLLTLSLWAPQPAQIWAQPLAETPSRAKPATVEPQAKAETLAVIELEPLTGVSPPEARVMTERIRALLVQSGRFQIMERSRMEAILKEQGFSQNALACSDSDCSLKLGKLLAVRRLVTGSISRLGNLYTLTARILDVEKGQILQEAYLDCQGSLQQVLTQEVPRLIQSLLGQAQTLPPLSISGQEKNELLSLYHSQAASPLLAGGLNLIPGLGLGYWSLNEWGYALLHYLALGVVAGLYVYRQEAEPPMNPEELNGIVWSMFGAVHLASFTLGILLANQHNAELRQRLGLQEHDLQSWQTTPMGPTRPQTGPSALIYRWQF